MSDEDFDPYQADRPPRSEGFSEETQEICRLIEEERGDQRIGQFIINTLRNSDKHDKIMKNEPHASHKEVTEQLLWAMDAPELLKAIKQMADKND